ncbi:MAG: M28 family peptidase [Firmicutes bacterium]|nr:M28 family peptidase [Bacillota bacterium]
MKKTNLVITIIVVSISLFLSLFVLFTPIPQNSETEFSAVKAAEYISVLSNDPHSVLDEEAHEEVRLYIKNQLIEFVGVSNVEEMNYTKEELGEDTDYGIQNLLATIPGNSETGILLVAHYDSRGNIGRDGELGRSYGAADDGYGLAVLLEVARLFADQTLENSIYILVTDAEEVGLYGAVMAAQEQELMDKIGFVINIEARGTEGAAYMFETSRNNELVIDFYRNANLPVTYSVATAVYAVMPNSTDFSEFLKADKQGANFAVLDGFYNYHTPLDNYTNISLTSIQHYGEQIIPLVSEFTSNTIYSDVNYFVGTQDQVFFTILPNVLIAYTDTFGTVMNIILIVAFIALIVVLQKKKQIIPMKILKYTGVIFLFIVVAVIIGLVVSQIAAFLGKTTWNVTYVRMQGTEIPTLLSMVGVITLFAFIFKKKYVLKEDKMAFMLAGIGINLVFALLTGLVLSGASFLFFVPALFGLISLYVLSFVKNRTLNTITLSQNIIWNILIFVPLLYSLFLALTIGGLLALLLLLVIALSVVIPSVFIQLNL